MQTAFGLSLAVDPAIEIPGIGDPAEANGASETDAGEAGAAADAASAGEACAAAPGAEIVSASETDAAIALQPPTRVRLAPAELTQRWRSVEGEAESVRELRDGGRTLLSVELAPSAGYLLYAPGFARVLVTSDGTDLLCAPEPRSEEWAILLAAQALPLAATLRGLEVLHASGVVLRDGALARRAALFAGPQGAGKSSLAAALLRRGATLLSDDTVALRPDGETLLAHPGAALLHLRDAEHERLSDADRAQLGSSREVLGKRRWTPRLADAPAPFGGLFLLERSRNGGAPVERIDQVDPFALLSSTFNLCVRTPQRLVRHLDLAVALAASGQVYRLRVQPSLDATQLAEVVSERLREL